MDKPKTVLIVGGSRGIGAACARLFAADGATILLTYHHRRVHAERVIASLADPSQASHVPCDLSDEASVRALADAARERLQAIDVLIISAAAGMEPGKAADYAQRVNARGPVLLVEHLAPLCRAGAVIFFITSHEAHLYGRKQAYGPYAMIAQSKHAGEAGILGLREQLEARGIHLRIISADIVEDSPTAKLLEWGNRGLLDERRAILGRLPNSADVASVVHGLAGEAPSVFGDVSYVWGLDGYLDSADSPG